MLLLRTRNCISHIRGVSKHCGSRVCVNVMYYLYILWWRDVLVSAEWPAAGLCLGFDEASASAADREESQWPHWLGEYWMLWPTNGWVLGVTIWYVRTFSEASWRCGDLFFSLSFGKVEEYSNCPNNVRNLHVYFGQASRYYCVWTDMLSCAGSLAGFLMKSSLVWRLLFSRSNLEQFIQGWCMHLYVCIVSW